MKLKKALLLSLLSLTLAGCSSGKSSGTKGGNEDTAEKGDIGNTPTETPEETDPSPSPSDSDPGNTGGEGDTGDPEGEGEEEKKEEVNDTNWLDEIWAMMKKYLGGNVLPYFDVGKTYTGSYVSAASGKAYLQIDSGEIYGTTVVDNFKKAYTDAQWTLGTETTTQITASLASKGLSVTMKSVSGIMSLLAYYDEPYDETTLTDWTDDINSLIDKYMDNHTVPYVYLGTANPVASYKSPTITVAGGLWDEKIATNAEAIYKKAGYTVAVTSDTYSSIVTATKTLDDKCVITVVIDSYNSTTYKKTNCTITIAEGYNPSAFTGWDSEFNQYKTSYFHDHDIPDFYLGTKSPDYTYTANYNRLLVKGKNFCDEMVTAARAKLDSSWSILDETTNSSPAFYCWKQFDDGCRIQMYLYNSSVTNLIPYLYIHYDEPKTITSTVTDWSDDVKSMISTNIASGVTIPYVYLGSDTITPTWTASSHTLKLTGAAPYNAEYGERAFDTFKAAGWTTTRLISSAGIGMKAETKTADGDVVKVTLSAQVSVTANPSLSIAVTEVYDTSRKQSDWPTAITDDLKKYYSRTIPYVYLGTREPSGSYTSTTNLYTIKGVTWNDQIYTDFEAAFKAESEKEGSDVTWTVTENQHATYGKQLIATGKVTGQDELLTVTLYHSAATSPVPYITVTTTDDFSVPTNGEWEGTVKTLMTTNYGNYTAPYVYLGTTSETASVDKNSKAMTVTGGKWNTKVISTAKTQLEAEGYTVEQGRGYYGGADLYAYKLYDDGHSFTYYIYRSAVSSTTAKIACQIYYGAPQTSDSATDWSSSTKTLIANNLHGYSLPYLSTGVSQMTASVYSSTMKSDNVLQFKYAKTSGWTFSNIYKAVETLKKDNSKWTFHFNHPNQVSNSASAYGSVYGELIQDDGSKIFIKFYGSSYSAAYLYVSYASAYTATTGGSWSSDTTKEISSYTNGNTIPYIDLGTTASTAAVSTNTTNGAALTITGGIWDEKMYANAEAVFKADTEKKWTTYYSINQYGDKSLVAVAACTDGSVLTLTVDWNYYSTTGEKRAYLTVIII